MRRVLFTIFGMLCLVASASGQAPAATVDQTELVRSLLERIDRLEKRVDELEAKQACSPRTCEPNASAIGVSAVGPPLQAEQTAAQEAPQQTPAPAPSTRAGIQNHEHAAPLQEQ